jgi:parallel beta helix pectate lyase-like protein
MNAFQRVAAVLIFPAIAWLGAACDGADPPTEPVSPGASFVVSKGRALWVNDDAPPGLPPGTGCPHPGYNTIQAAVDDALPGDRINVCPGTYTEQVTITGAGKNNIQLRSVGHWQAVIRAPTPMVGTYATKAIVRVNAAQGVTILAFTITGPSGVACGGNISYGVRVDNDGSANILGNHITQIRDPDVGGQRCGTQNGMGVVVGGHPNDLAEFSTGSARIEGNVVDNYQKNGVVVGGSGSSAVIAANRVFGSGPQLIIAQNGIEVLRDATAEVKHNFSSGHIYTGPMPVTPAGVLLISAGTVDIHHNTVAQNDVDMYAFASSAPGSLTHNRTRSSTFDGIVVDATNVATVGENHSEQNGGAGIGLYEGATDNTIENNQVDRNGTNLSTVTCPITFPPCYGGGILLHDASDNIVRGNHIRNNGTLNNLDNTDGIRINAPSMGNSIQSNHLRGNVTHDCHDASTGNTWADNHGGTSFGTAVCSDPDPQNDFAVEAGWDPGYPWYSGYELTTDYDWPSLYSAIDVQIQGLLELLPRLGFGGVRRPSP